MCSLRDFPELRDCSLTDKNASMAFVIKRVKPEVSMLIHFCVVLVLTISDDNCY